MAGMDRKHLGAYEAGKIFSGVQIFLVTITFLSPSTHIYCSIGQKRICIDNNILGRSDRYFTRCWYNHKDTMIGEGEKEDPKSAKARLRKKLTSKYDLLNQKLQEKYEE